MRVTGPVVEFSVDLETPSALLLLSPRAGVVVDNRSAEVGPVWSCSGSTAVAAFR